LTWIKQTTFIYVNALHHPLDPLSVACPRRWAVNDSQSWPGVLLSLLSS
jgi:hypothetical protein